jgi:hypothetical protein
MSNSKTIRRKCFIIKDNILTTTIRDDGWVYTHPEGKNPMGLKFSNSYKNLCDIELQKARVRAGSVTFFDSNKFPYNPPE